MLRTSKHTMLCKISCARPASAYRIHSSRSIVCPMADHGTQEFPRLTRLRFNITVPWASPQNGKLSFLAGEMWTRTQRPTQTHGPPRKGSRIVRPAVKCMTSPLSHVSPTSRPLLQLTNCIAGYLPLAIGGLQWRGQMSLENAVVL